MKTYTIIAGINGTGKSSLTGSLKAQTTSLGTIIDADKITADTLVSSLARDNPALKKIRSCLERGIASPRKAPCPVILPTRLSAKPETYYIRLYYIGLDSAEESIRRIANRVQRGGHAIPSDLVERRFQERWSNLAAVLPYCDEAIFFDNDNGFVEVAVYENGELLEKGNRSPLWLQELKAYLATLE